MPLLFTIHIMQFTGKITKITPEVAVGQKMLPKISFMLEEIGEMEDYKKNSIVVDVLGEKVELIKQFKEGDVVKASLNFKASEYNDKLYNRVTAWRLEASDGSAPSAPASTGGDDDLPF